MTIKELRGESESREVRDGEDGEEELLHNLIFSKQRLIIEKIDTKDCWVYDPTISRTNAGPHRLSATGTNGDNPRYSRLIHTHHSTRES